MLENIEKIDFDALVSKIRREFSSALGDNAGLLKDEFDKHLTTVSAIAINAQRKLDAARLRNAQLENLLKENKIEIPALPDAIKSQ